MDSQRFGLLVGCGSIGKRHAAAMNERYGSFSIVDPDQSVRDWVGQNFGSHIKVFSSITEWAKTCQDASLVTAVIATWGPRHFSDFKDLVEVGIKRVICEKPLADSIEKSEQMLQLSIENEVNTLVGIQRRNTGFYASIEEDVQTYCGGTPELITVTGGAQCLVTNGMHWLDFACQAFEGLPRNVVASLNNMFINPREKSLQFWEGVAVWEFAESRRFSINLTNNSYIMGEIELVGPKGKIIVQQNSQVFGSRIPNEKIQPGWPTTRTVMLENAMTQINSEQTGNAFLAQLELIDGEGADNYDFKQAAPVLNSMIGALESNREGIRVNLPIQPGTDAYSRNWAIS